MTKDKDLIRLMLQSLQELGFHATAHQLELESGLQLENTAITEFKKFYIAGDWENVDSLVDSLELIKISRKEFRFKIRTRKFMELLLAGNRIDALRVMRKELAPLRTSESELHQLSKLMLQTPEQIAYLVNNRSRSVLLNELSQYLSPKMCVPPHRLQTLINQAFENQRQKCIYHNSDDLQGLLVDHQCLRQDFPNYTSHIFNEHHDEVWYMAFSHDGTLLASASRDARTIIWNLTQFSIKLILDDHKKAVSYLSWSPDDKLLLTGSNDHSLKLWDTKSGELIRTFAKHREAVTCCQFLPDGKSFISGSTERNVIHWQLDGEIIHEWTGIRAMDIEISKDGKILYICSEKKIKIYDLDTKQEIGELSEEEAVTSISLTKDDKYLLVNLCISEIHLWELSQKSIVKKYFGQKQGRFVIRSTLGGVNENFVLSGSEDANVYVWHREHGNIIENLKGHDACVNAVAWSPTQNMFASASDDHQIRIWSPANK